MAKELAKVVEEENSLVSFGLDEDQLLQEIGEGHSDFGSGDITIPFLRVLQQLSPQVTKGKAEYIAGAEAGNLINTASKQIYDGEQGVLLVPCRFQNRFLEWKPRKMGGGLVRDFGDNEAAAKARVAMTGDKNQQLTAEGHEIVRTLQYWALVVDPETGMYEHVVFPLSSTQVRKSKDWNHTMNNRKEILKGKPTLMTTHPHFYTYKISTVLESNDLGSWYGIKVESHGRTLALKNGADIYAAAGEFRKLVDAGNVRTTEERPDGADEDESNPSPF